MIPLVTADEMRAAERAVIEQGGSMQALMRRAGRSVAARIAPGRRTVLILVGPGNNGGDAIVAAETLLESGANIAVYTYKRKPEDEQLMRVSSRLLRVEDDTDFEGLRSLLDSADVVVDGLLGIGRKRPVEDPLAGILSTVNSAHVAHRIAIDIPTGVDADSGAVDSIAFSATSTICLGFAKRGLFQFPGAGYAGEVEVVDLGFTPSQLGELHCGLLQSSDVTKMLPRRTRDWNKGKSGTVLVIAGSAEYSGAPSLVAVAAYRAGAGLVRVATPEAARPIVAARAPEPVFAPTPGSTSHLTPSSVVAVGSAAQKATAFAIGPGMGTEDLTSAFLECVLEDLKKLDLPGVVDADALNCLAKLDNWWSRLPAKTVLTPHPGEMSRLCGVTVEEVERSRISLATQKAATWGVVVLLKGANTVIASPNGDVAISSSNAPNLGTAGTGDVLTGIISGLMAQGLHPYSAAQTGAFVHSMAGERIAAEQGDTGTLASDLWDHIPRVTASLRRQAH
jgi:hydroxyethylthiazole kinase-like uncharacterized protein yjeF